MITSKKVFLSPSVFCAYVDRVHPKHPHAAAFFRYLGQENYRLFTDLSSVMEAYRRIYQEISPSLAKDLLRTLFVSNINILYPEESDYKAALKALVTYQTTDLTYQEALMAVLANRRDIMQICTVDYLRPLFGLSAFYLPV